MDRRALFGLAAAAVSTRALAGNMAADGSLPGDSSTFVALWPGTPPGGEGVNLTLKITDAPQADGYHVRAVSGIATPGLIVYRPARPDGRGLLVIPGGGYSSEGGDRGGREIAQYFAGRGITCFILRYRLPGEGWAARADVPLQDAQRAMRLIRARAAEFGIDPARLAAIGFSAGGHLSASLATRFAARVHDPADAIDGQDARPLVAGLLYPVITMGLGAHGGSRDELLGADPGPQMIDAYSVERHVAPDTPPAFLCLAADDPVVPPFENGIAMFGALHAAGIPAELHVFEAGGHGFSLHWAQDKPAAAWPDLFLAWAATHGFR